MQTSNTDKALPPPFYRPDPLVPILFISLIFFMTFLARVMFSPLMPSIETEMNLSHAQAGSMFLIMSIGYFFALAGSGFISARIFHRFTIAAAASGAGMGLLLVSVSHEYWQLQASIFILGMAAGTYLPSGITSLTNMVDARNWGKAVSIHEMAPNLAFVTAPVIAQFFLYFTWRTMPAATGAVCLLLGASFAIWGKGGDFPGKPPGVEAIRDLAATRAFWLMVLLFAVAISSTMGLYTMLPLYLIKELEVSQGFANSLVALSRLPGVAMALAAGWAVDRFGPRRTIILMLGLTGMATIGIGVCKDPGLATGLIIAQAGLSTGYFPAGFALLSAIAPAKHRNVAISLAIPLAFVYGGGIAPAIIGITGDAGSFAAGIVLVGVLICLGAILPIFFKN
ncbi:MAG: MFS transporter [Desulfosalsimonas sp.]|uniref:MFS transporter n=1 Tax=Desulfosalsimonas sp. TaxID=3073848 RepID=UPI0039708DF6